MLVFVVIFTTGCCEFKVSNAQFILTTGGASKLVKG